MSRTLILKEFLEQIVPNLEEKSPHQGIIQFQSDFSPHLAKNKFKTKSPILVKRNGDLLLTRDVSEGDWFQKTLGLDLFQVQHGLTLVTPEKESEYIEENFAGKFGDSYIAEIELMLDFLDELRSAYVELHWLARCNAGSYKSKSSCAKVSDLLTSYNTYIRPDVSNIELDFELRKINKKLITHIPLDEVSKIFATR